MKNNKTKESKRQRNERIVESHNGLTTRTRVVSNKKSYNRAKTKRELNNITN